MASTPAQQALADEMEKFVDKYEMSTRPLQKRQFECQAACASGQSGSDDYRKCLQTCSKGMAHVSNVFQQEMQAFQNQYIRCAQRCEDNVRQQFRLGPSDQLRPEHEAAMIACIDTCSVAQTNLIPALAHRLDAALHNA